MLVEDSPLDPGHYRTGAGRIEPDQVVTCPLFAIVIFSICRIGHYCPNDLERRQPPFLRQNHVVGIGLEARIDVVQAGIVQPPACRLGLLPQTDVPRRTEPSQPVRAAQEGRLREVLAQVPTDLVQVRYLFDVHDPTAAEAVPGRTYPRLRHVPVNQHVKVGEARLRKLQHSNERDRHTILPFQVDAEFAPYLPDVPHRILDASQVPGVLRKRQEPAQAVLLRLDCDAPPQCIRPSRTAICARPPLAENPSPLRTRLRRRPHSASNTHVPARVAVAIVLPRIKGRGQAIHPPQERSNACPTQCAPHPGRRICRRSAGNAPYQACRADRSTRRAF